MKIQISKDTYKPDIRALWEYCFSDSNEYVDFYFKNKFDGEDVVVCVDEEEDRAIGAISLNKHYINLNYKTFLAPYVVGVSTLPEARGNGIMRDAMIFSLEEMKRRGVVVSILMPIDFRLYTRFGFENCYDMLNIRVDVFSLRNFKLSGEFKKAKDERDARVLFDLYSHCMSRYNGYSLRSEKYFKDFIEEMSVDGGQIYMNYEGGELRGYISYSILNGEFHVREIYALDIKSYKSMLKFIFNHNTQVKDVYITTSMDDRLYNLLDNPKTASFEKKPFMMGRIIDIENFVEKLKIRCNTFEAFKIRVIDDYLENNNGIFVVENIEGKLSIKKKDLKADLFDEVSLLEDENDSLDRNLGDISDVDVFTINEMTSVLFGYKTIEEIDYLREEPIREIISLKEAFRIDKRINHINEYV